MSTVLHVISHTHWDREWYQPFESFRVRLVDLVDNLLAVLARDPEFRAFHLDGQTIVLDDYLEIRPEREQELRAHVAAGRLLIGPWYLLNDEFLTSGEATVRNLQVGHRVCEAWGANMRVGYLPDQFGNIGQMPQILRGFGIDTACFGRGWQLTEDRKCEFTWASPDGSEVLASFMAFWYNNAQWFPEDPADALAYAERARDQLAPHCPSGHLLLMNGVDHLEAQGNLSPILGAIRERLPDGDSIVHSTLPDYFAAVREALGETELAAHTGELREDRWGSVLAGTLSSRMYLKQRNDHCQRLLERITEPLASFAWTLACPYPEAFLLYAWKRLLQNHPHDSICGCSTDDTHRAMLPRFDQVQLVAEAQRDRALRAIAERVNTAACPEEGAVPIVLVSTLPWKRTDPVEFAVDFPLGDAPAAVTVEDGAGEEVPISLLGVEDVNRRDISPVELPKSVAVRRFRLGLVAENVGPGALTTLWVRPEAWRPTPPSEVLRGGRILENDYLQVTVEPNGALTVRDWVTGYTYTDWLVFADNGDAGDEYTHTAPLADRVCTTHGWAPTVTVIESGPARARVEITGTLALPASASRCERSRDLVPCEIRTTVMVAAGVPRIECETTVVNRACDHRLRVLFPTDLGTDRTYAEGQFDVVARERVPAEWPHASATQPCHGFVAVGDGHRGLCLVPEGMPEYELLPDGRATLALTLMRCVGCLSRGGEAAGEDITHDSQMLGEFPFRYALAPYAGELMTSGAPRQAEQQRVPIQVVQTTRHEGSLADGHRFLSVEPEQLVVTATKLSPDGCALVVRLYNPTDAEVAGTLATGPWAVEAWTADLEERPVDRLAGEPGSGIPFSAGSRKIVTILLQRADA